MQQPDGPSDMDSIDLAALSAALRRGWKTAFACALVAVVFQVIAVRSAPPLYRVEMRVAAVDAADRDADQAAATQSRQANGRPGHPPTMNRTQFTTYLESLGSRDVADALAGNPAVLKALFPEQWDSTHTRWRQESGRIQRLESGVRSLLGWRVQAWQPPGGIEVERFLAGVIVVSDAKRHDLATIHLRTTRPDFAVRFLALLNRVADDRARAGALAQARQVIAGLESLPNARTDKAIQRALDKQQDIEVAALSTAPFAARVLDDPSAQPDPSDRPFKSLLAAFLLGIAAGLALDWSFRRLRDRLSKARAEPQST